MPSNFIENLLKKEFSRREFVKLVPALFISLFGVTALIDHLISHAATPVASGEAESGTTGGNTTTFSDTSASGEEAVRFGSAAASTSPADSQATATTVNLLALLYSMPTKQNAVIIGQQFGAQSYAPYNFYDSDILTIKNGFTESDAGGSVTVGATNTLPALMNCDLSFLLDTNAPTYSSQTPASVRQSYWQGVANGYGADNTAMDGAIANFQAGSIISLTYHFDNPLTGGTFYDLGDQSGLNISATTIVTTATSTSAIGSTIGTYNGTLSVSNASSFTNPAGIIQVATSPAVVTASAVTNVTTILECPTATLTFGSVANIAVGQTVTGSGITGTVYVSAVNTTTKVVTITAWTSAGSIGSLSSSGTYTFTGYTLIQYTGISSNQFTQCLVISGAGTIASGATVTTGQCGSMTSSFFSDPTSQAYTNFNNTTNGMFNSVIQFCLAMQNASPTCSVIYRPFHEPNGNWFWWGQGGNLSPADQAAPWYPAAYRFIQQQLWNAGAHNVLFVWGPIRNDGSGFSWPAADMTSYPGDNVVDIAGVDMYGEDPTAGGIQASQAAIYNQRGWTLATQKPFAIFEFGWYNNFNTGTVGQGNATIYNASSNPSGELYTKNNVDIISGLNLSTAGTSTCGPAYFMSWGQVWAIRLQNNFDSFYANSKIATQTDLISYKWNS
jgi:beta-mannanase